MHAYLLKSRIRRRRAGVDILIEHYFNVLSNSNGLQKVFFDWNRFRSQYGLVQFTWSPLQMRRCYWKML